MISISDTQKIGLLAVGNLLFISGLAFIIGIERTFWFFFQRHKLKASSAFFIGIFIVLFGWPMVGMVVESYGFLLLFRGFIPATVAFLSRVPVLGFVLNLPLVRTVVRQIGTDTGRNNV
ncbi:hypothetical protein RDWZM_000187 [Blomia tropicalis]|uniref:Vesicle transport protein GOT1B n=1 Tax=Blomia tropicalis TaxID=40697 RepID=A0A9Q0MCC9_BLOTA|nr:hypothetical protein RDWZM_000187 [Blomia tropicalis]